MKKDNIIREIHEQDLEQLQQILKNVFNNDTSYEKMQHLYKMCENNKDIHILGYYIKDNLVGTVTLNILTLPSGKEATIWNLAVKDEYRGLGIATKLMNKAEEIAKQEDTTRIWLFSGFHRKNAHELYRKLGYDENRDKAFVKHIKIRRITNMNMDKKSNIFVLHSLNGDTINIWGQDIKENFNKQGIEVVLPKFPIRADSSYDKFEEILKEYLDNKTLNENSIVIGHSIGNAYFIRFCKEMNYIPKAYIAVAPGAVYNIPSNRNDYTVKVKAQAYCKQEQLDFIKEKVKVKYCLYSDENEPKEEMFKRFIEDTNSIGIYLKYYNHFDGYHRIYKIPELTELINKLLNEDE